MVSTGQPAALLVDIKGACTALGLGRSTVYALIQQGTLRPVRVGRAVRFRVIDLEAFVNALSEAI